MTIHYHGTPITPRSVLEQLAGRHFCVSFAQPQDISWVHKYGQSVMLDNGAYSAWKTGLAVDCWDAYYVWCQKWLEWRTTWAVIPDVVGGSESDNDRLIDEWPYGKRGAPVWHMHESIDRLLHLVTTWDRVCIGSSAQFSTVGSYQWHSRMASAFNAICQDGGGPPAWIHMLRGMQCSEWVYPFSSVDSTDIGRNHNRGGSVRDRADRWDSRQCPGIWTKQPTQGDLFYGS